MLAMAMGLLLLLIVLLTIGVPLVGVAAVKLGLLAWYAPTAVRYVRKNRPRSLSPASIIADGLPSLLAA